MPSIPLKWAISCLRDSATDPHVWADALPLISNALGAVGASCFACNDETGAVEWVYISGPLAERTSDYIQYYAALDIFRPFISTPARPGWITLSESLPQTTLGRSEWYQDFILPAGLADAISIQLHQAGSRRVIFGAHYEKVQAIPAPQEARLRHLLQYLQEGARLGQLQRMLNLRTALGNWILEYLGDALFVTYDDGRVMELNAVAETLLAHGRALTLSHGRLVARDVAEAQQLSTLIAKTSKAVAFNASASRMLVGRTEHGASQLVTVFPIPSQLVPNERPAVVIRVVDLFDPPASTGADLAALFGLSPAENRLVQALIQGKTLQQLTTEFGVQMPTLRAQMRAILRKCGVPRQVDLMRVLLRVH